jgi:hypothetical protein
LIARVVLTALLLAGCMGPGLGPGSVQPSDPPGASASATQTTAADATSVPTAVPMPAGFPVHSSMVPVEPEPRYIAAWESDELPPEVYAFYLEQLSQAGFALDLAAPGGEAAIIRFTAPDGIAYQLDMTGRAPVEIALGPRHD